MNSQVILLGKKNVTLVKNLINNCISIVILIIFSVSKWIFKWNYLFTECAYKALSAYKATEK